METNKMQYVNANMMEFEVGTTGIEKYGDAETFIRISDDSSTGWSIVVMDANGGVYKIVYLKEFILRLEGNAELYGIIEGLDFIVKELKNKVPSTKELDYDPTIEALKEAVEFGDQFRIRSRKYADALKSIVEYPPFEQTNNGDRFYEQMREIAKKALEYNNER